MNKLNFSIITCFLLLQLSAFSQQGMKTLSLDDMSAFQAQAGNWRIVGEVKMDPTIDIHQKEESAGSKKKKRKRRKKEDPHLVSPVSFEPGSGILLNFPDEAKKDNLITNWTHGDIILELDVMLPKGSNSGIYLQGRYEIQLLDSWGVKGAKFSDIGGIYRNWETDPETSYMGKAPLVNAAKAPGLWQKLKISFQAPRFDEEGNKVANARLHFVELNGIRIHENVEIPKYTGGAITNEEVADGPLMIQGDHGPVALRNIRYQLMKDPDIKLTDLTYTLYKGEFHTPEEVLTSGQEDSGSIERFTYEVSDVENDFGIRFNGNLHIPEPSQYTFSSSVGGNCYIIINEQNVLQGSGNTRGSIYLEAGVHPIMVVYYKNVPWVKPRLALTVSGENTYPVDLHAFNSAPPDDGAVSPIYIHPGSRPKLIRAFLDYEGKLSERLTHTIGVGEPEIHYIYNLKAGNLACVWKGNFMDATPMWHKRGDGSFVPRGMIQYLSAGPAVATLANELSSFSEKATEEVYVSKGYTLDSVGRPSFNYIYNETEISDKIYPDEQAAKFTREVSFSNVAERTFFKLAEGSKIEELSKGTFIIGDKQFYITMISGAEPVVRKIGGKKELIVPVDSRRLIYSIIW